MELGNALDSLLNGLVNIMAQEALKYTILSGKNLGYTQPVGVPGQVVSALMVVDCPRSRVASKCWLQVHRGA